MEFRQMHASNACRSHVSISELFEHLVPLWFDTRALACSLSWHVFNMLLPWCVVANAACDVANGISREKMR